MMMEYIAVLLCVASICGIAGVLAPEGKRGGISRHMNLVCSLVALCVIAAPFVDLIGEIRDNGIDLGFIGERGENYAEVYRDTFNEYLLEYNAENVSVLLKDMLCSEFEIKVDDMEVWVQLLREEGECLVESVMVGVKGEAISKDPHSIVEYVYNLFACECEIVYI